MILKFQAPLIGVDSEEDNWLLNFQYTGIKIEKVSHNEADLLKKYQYFKFDNRIPIYFDTEDNNTYTYYELTYEEEIYKEPNLNFVANGDDERIFFKCQRIIDFINLCFGTIIKLGMGNFYIDSQKNFEYREGTILTYSPSILEDYSKIIKCDKESRYLLDNIEKILNNKIEDKIFETILSTYNANLSISNMKIAFLNLVTCLEILFEKGNSELTFQISRGVAVLLSESKQDGIALFDKMKMLYGIRSKLVHSGEWEPKKYYGKYNDGEPFEDLKLIVIKCVRKYIILNFNKDSFIELINSSGYGEIYNQILI